MSAAIPGTAARLLFSTRPLGSGSRLLVRHAVPCSLPAAALAAPRYIGGSAPEAPSPQAVSPVTFGQYRSMQRRLDRWELQHLREHAADLAERLKASEQARQMADDAADYWREQALNVDLREGERLGLDMDGTIHVLSNSMECTA